MHPTMAFGRKEFYHFMLVCSGTLKLLQSFGLL